MPLKEKIKLIFVTIFIYPTYCIMTAITGFFATIATVMIFIGLFLLKDKND